MKQKTQKAEKDIKGKGINGKTIFGVICVILAAIVVIAAGIGSSWFTNGNIPTWFNYWGKGDINEPRQFVVGGEEDDNGELEFETAYIWTKIKAFFKTLPPWAWLLIAAVVLLLFMPLLSLIFPAVGSILVSILNGALYVLKAVLKGLLWFLKSFVAGVVFLVTLPFKGIAALIRKIRGGKKN